MLDEAPIILLNSDPLVLSCAVCGAIRCCCGSKQEDDSEKMWEVLSNI
jgi:hypothetical protein